jgi:Flp pilus assembly protein TadG
MLEFVLSFPLVLMLILACLQMAHLLMAREVVHYAAYCAARSALVSGDLAEAQVAAQRAASAVCAWITMGSHLGESVIPGWGRIPGSGGVTARTRVVLREESPWNIQATVEHDFGLMMPIVGPIMANLSYRATANLYEAGQWDYPFPELTLQETVVLPRPYRYQRQTRVGW